MQDESDQETVGGIKMSEWISVKDRLPEPFVSVLGYMPDATPFPIEIARRQKTGAFRSARPNGVIK